jgi:hypothetical protein
MSKSRAHKAPIQPQNLFLTGKELQKMLLLYNNMNSIKSYSQWIGVHSNTVRNYFDKKEIPLEWAQGLIAYVGGTHTYNILLNKIRGNHDNQTIKDSDSTTNQTPQLHGYLETQTATATNGAETSGEPDAVRKTPGIKARSASGKGRTNGNKNGGVPQVVGTTGVQVQNPVS